MLFDLSSPCSLSSKYISDLVIVYPNPGDPPLPTAFDGKASLHVPSARRTPRIRVALIGRCALLMANRWTSSEVLRVEHEIDRKPSADWLSPGTHDFPFTLHVPGQAPPSVTCAYGRIDYSLHITAYGCARLGRDLIHEILAASGLFHCDEASHLLRFPQRLSYTITANSPTKASNAHYTGLPDPYSFQTELLSKRLGPARVELSSKYLLVAGYLTLGLFLPDLPPQGIIDVHDITVVLRQHCILHRDGMVQDMPDQETLVWSLKRDGGENLNISGSGHVSELHLVQQMRLPQESRLTATTPASVQSPIVISHSFSVTVHYTDRRDQGRDKNSPHELNVIDKNVTISSCCCLIEHFQLPAYSRIPQGDKVVPDSFDLTDIGLCYTCLCRLTDGISLRQIYGIVTPEEIDFARGIRDSEQRAWKRDAALRIDAVA